MNSVFVTSAAVHVVDDETLVVRQSIEVLGVVKKPLVSRANGVDVSSVAPSASLQTILYDAVPGPDQHPLRCSTDSRQRRR